MIWVVGLTGGIGSGKSAAAARFAALGAAIVDADAIAHELTGAAGAAIAAIRTSFGPESLTADGALDRKAMRQQAFTDPAVRTRLQDILHPLIRAECEDRIRRLASADFAYGVLVAPLLLEANGYRDRVNRVCVVDCPEELQITRTIRRSGLSRAEVTGIMATQISRVARCAVADDIIDNSTDIAGLHTQVDGLHAQYQHCAKSV
jgi:dephospho-CoA kinase